MGRKKASSDNVFPAKYTKVLGEEWMNECDSASAEDLKKKIIDAEASIEEQERLRDSDQALKELKDKVKDLGGGYKDALFYQKAKIKYIMKTLESRGQVLKES